MKHIYLFNIFFCSLCANVLGQVAAEFVAYPQTICSEPFEVSFYNQSQNDTSWLWDFGDGTTSRLENPIHQYASAGSYTVSLQATGVGGVDSISKTGYITISNPPADPVLSKTADTVSCGTGVQFTASGQDDHVWYNAIGQMVHRGDTLDLPFLPKTADYYVQAEQTSAPMKVGPAAPHLLGSYLTSAYGGITFETYTDIRLRSFLVSATTSKQREIWLEDSTGAVIQTLSIYIQPGPSRVALNWNIPAGKYTIRGNLPELHMSLNNLAFPYEIPGVISLTGSTFRSGYYFYFYDWEIETVCTSNPVFVHAEVNPISSTNNIASDTTYSDCGDSLLIYTAATDSVIWYNQLNEEVGRGDTLAVDFVNKSEMFRAQSLAFTSQTLSVGPVDENVLGSGSYHRAPEGWIYFEVFSDIELVSLRVDARTAGQRDILIINEDGLLMEKITVTVPAGSSRIAMHTRLKKGTYSIGGRYLNLYRNEQVSTSYPYSIPGLLSINSSSGGREFYNYFYDWEIQTACKGESDSVFVKATQRVQSPTISPSIAARACNGNIQFVASGQDSVYWYDESGTNIYKGDSLNLTALHTSTSYQAFEVLESSSKHVGPRDSQGAGVGAMYNDFWFEYLEFEVFAPMIIQSVWVDADQARHRAIELRDTANNLLKVVSVHIPDGQSRVTLNLELIPGIYRLGGKYLGLFYNSTDAMYPYREPGIVSINTSSQGKQAYYYFYDWEISAICKSAPATAQVAVWPIAPPVAIPTQVTIPCKGKGQSVALGSDSTRWYNSDHSFFSLGDTLKLPSLITSTSFYARNETGLKVVHGGPSLNPVGPGLFMQMDTFYLEFDVHQESRLRSVQVYAGSAGNRTFEYRDKDENILDSVTVFLPEGLSRVPLNFDLIPGIEFQIAVRGHTDLFHRTVDIQFPYMVGPYLSITGSSFKFRNWAYYYFFFDWEVSGPGCQSSAEEVTVTVTPPARPTVVRNDTVCMGEKAVFETTDYAAWYDVNGNLLGLGQRITTPPLTLRGNYKVRTESMEPTQRVGPANSSAVSGQGSYHYSANSIFLEFEVFEPLRLNSVWVDAENDGQRIIRVEDDERNIIETRTLFIPAGKQRIFLGIELEPGSYMIGGRYMNLYCNTDSAVFPYEIPGMINISGANSLADRYNFFYDWEVQPMPCASSFVTFPVDVYHTPTPYFDYIQNRNEVTFFDQNWGWEPLHWDFGDGNIDSVRNPVHTYQNAGTYYITLTMSNGYCDSSYVDSVRIDYGIGIEQAQAIRFDLFPNPGKGGFQVEVDALEAESFKVLVYDIVGQLIYQSSEIRTSTLNHYVDLGDKPDGAYIVHIQTPKGSLSKQWMLIR